MNYTPINWQNGEYGNTPLNSENLNHMDNAIKTIAEESKANTESIEYCQEDIEANAGKIEENTELISGLRTDVTELQNKISGDITPHSVDTPALTAAEGNFTNVTVSGEAVIPTIKGNNAAVSMPNGISTTDVAANKIEATTVTAENLSVTKKAEIISPTIKAESKYTPPTIYGEGRQIYFPDGVDCGGMFSTVNFWATELTTNAMYTDELYARSRDEDLLSINHGMTVVKDLNCNNIYSLGDIQCGRINSFEIHSSEEIIDGHGNVLSEVAANARGKLELKSNFEKVTDSANSIILGIDALGQSEQDRKVKFIFTSGAIAPSAGTPISQAIQANNTRCTSDIIFLPAGTVINAPSGYELYLAHALTDSGNIDIAQTWVTEYTTNMDGYWRMVCRNKTNTSAVIQPSECNVTVTAVPTPTNPIPIVSASGKNLLNIKAGAESKNGVTALKNWDGSINISGTATATTTLLATPINLKKGTYTFSGAPNGSTSTYFIQVASADLTKSIASVTEPRTVTFEEDTDVICRIRIISGVTLDATVYPQIEYGSDATEYERYGSARVVARNKNLVYEMLKGCNIDGNGKVISGATYDLAFAKVEKGKSYALTFGSGISTAYGFFSGKPSIGSITYNNVRTVDTSTYVVAPINGYIGLRCVQNFEQVQIEEGATASDYVPYESNIIYIPFEMRSVGDIHDELIIDKNGGRYIQRVGYEDMSTLSWYDGTGSAYWYSRGLADKVRPSTSTTEIPNILCTTLTANTRNVTTGKGTNFITVYSNGNIVATSTEKPGGILLYELATPIITELGPGDLDYIVSLYTYKPITVFDTKCIGTVSYAGDVESYIDNKFNYSYADRIIGKWADGKDLHQIVIQTTTPSEALTDTEIFTLPNCNIKRIDGTLRMSSGNQDPINFYYASSYYIATWVKDNAIRMRLTSTYTNCPCEIIVEYTLK